MLPVDVDTAYEYVEYRQELDEFEAAAALASVSMATGPDYVLPSGAVSVSDTAETRPQTTVKDHWLDLDELEEIGDLDEFLNLFEDLPIE